MTSGRARSRAGRPASGGVRAAGPKTNYFRQRPRIGRRHCSETHALRYEPKTQQIDRKLASRVPEQAEATHLRIEQNASADGHLAIPEIQATSLSTSYPATGSSVRYASNLRRDADHLLRKVHHANFQVSIQEIEP